MDVEARGTSVTLASRIPAPDQVALGNGLLPAPAAVVSVNASTALCDAEALVLVATERAVLVNVKPGGVLGSETFVAVGFAGLSPPPPPQAYKPKTLMATSEGAIGRHRPAAAGRPRHEAVFEPGILMQAF